MQSKTQPDKLEVLFNFASVEKYRLKADKILIKPSFAFYLEVLSTNLFRKVRSVPKKIPISKHLSKKCGISMLLTSI